MQVALWQAVTSLAADRIVRECATGCDFSLTGGSASAGSKAGNYLWVLTYPEPWQQPQPPSALFRLALDEHPLT